MILDELMLSIVVLLTIGASEATGMHMHLLAYSNTLELPMIAHLDAL